MPESTALESVLKRDRLIVWVAVIAIVVISWFYLVHLAANMKATSGMNVMAIQAWGIREFLLMVLMWAVMMVGMMIPSATPAILNFARLSREHREHGDPFVPTTIFVLGYVVIWAAFSVVAALLQWELNSLALLSPAMVLTSPLVGGFVLVAAGAYQWAPIHKNFLARCRNFLEIFTNRFGEGTNAFLMGLENGFNCLGCCLVLMLLLFVGGVMNLLWVGLIALFVLIIKVVPYGDVCGRWTAVVMILGGLTIIVLQLVFNMRVL